MAGTKSHGYLSLGRLSEGEYSGPFFSTRPSPNHKHPQVLLYTVLKESFFKGSYKPLVHKNLLLL